MSLKLIAPSWPEIQKSCLLIAQRTKSDGFQPNIIVGVARGGWVPARLLADFLEIDDLTNLGISFYEDIASTKKRPSITQPVTAKLAGKLVLMVDDVADSGESLRIGRDHLTRLNPLGLKIATIFKKPWSIVTPDYYTNETDAWIIFPWEQAESTRSLKEKLSREGLSAAKIRRRLLDTGLDRSIVNAAMK